MKQKTLLYRNKSELRYSNLDYVYGIQNPLKNEQIKLNKMNRASIIQFIGLVLLQILILNNKWLYIHTFIFSFV